MNEKDNLNRISSSTYDIYGKLLDVAASGEYFGSAEEFQNTDFLKSGLFGYVTESLAMLMRDSSFHKTMVYRENFLNTAIMPKSIYNWAKMFSVDVLDAIPSARKATISLDIDTIDTIINNIGGNNNSTTVASFKKKYGIAENGNFMVIDKSNPIIAGSYYFMLEHSIEIYKNTNNQYIVKYCLNEEDKTTNFGSYSDGGLITTIRRPVGNKVYLYFDVLVFQYKAVEKTKIISGSTFLDTKVHHFDISGQICGLSLTYTKSNVTENVKLKFSNIEQIEDTESKQKIAYYSLIDKNTLEISFLTNTETGLPQAGGSLLLRTFVTEGFNGNINFTGDAVFLIKQDDIKSFPINVVLTQSPVMAGLDQTTLGEIKGNIISKLATRNTIITENDLNTWFATQSKLLSNVNNSEITFKKEIDTLLRRTFSAYLLLRDGVMLNEYLTKQSTANDTQDGALSDGSLISSVPSSYLSSVVPTNTIDVVVNVADRSNPNGNIILNANNSIAYNKNTQKYIYTNSSGEYKTPFYIVLDQKYNTLSYYYLETTDTSELEYTSLENQSNTLLLIPISSEVFHENLKPYEFKFFFASDTDLTNVALDNLNISFGSQKITLDASKYSFTKIKSEDDTDDNPIQNYCLTISAEFQTIENNSENPQIKLSFGESTTISVYEDNSVQLYLSLADNSFKGTFKTVRELSLFKSLNDIMISDLIINKDDNGQISSYVIRDIPVVASYWFKSSVNKKWFIKQLFVFINMLKTNLDKLETTTFFNIKFRNTYGISQYYTSTTTMLRLKLKIYLKKAAIDQYKGNLTTGYGTAEALQREIIDFIRVAVDRSNSEKSLVISKIIMQAQAAYINFIDHIDFLGLNGTFNQYVKNIEDTLSNEDKKYPLEYFSLDNTLETEGDVTTSRLLKDITFEII